MSVAIDTTPIPSGIDCFNQSRYNGYSYTTNINCNTINTENTVNTTVTAINTVNTANTNANTDGNTDAHATTNTKIQWCSCYGRY